MNWQAAARVARRVALVADSHGRVLPEVLAGLVGVDLIVHAGDVGGAQVLKALEAVAPVLAVSGNNDLPTRWPAAERARLAALPASAVLRLTGGLLAVEHGHRFAAVATRHARLRAVHADARWVLYGHSHRCVVDADATPWVLNPGACGAARAYGGAGWLELRRVGRDWRVWSSREAAQSR